MKSFFTKIRDVFSRVEFVHSEIPNSYPYTKRRMWKIWIILGALFLFQCYQIVKWEQEELDAKWGVTLHVSPRVKQMNFYHHSSLSNGNYYNTGNDGTLYWKPKDLKESILLNTFSENSPARDAFEPFSVALKMILCSLILINVGKAKYITQNTISKFVVVLVILLFLDPWVDLLIREPLGRQYILHITGGQFTANYPYHAQPFNYIFILLVPLLYLFPNRMMQLQKEQELTI